MEADCEPAGIKFLSFHSCRHGFATDLLHKGIDPVTTAKLGGWKSIRHVETYGHSQGDRTLANMLTDTELTQGQRVNAESKVEAMS